MLSNVASNNHISICRKAISYLGVTILSAAAFGCGIDLAPSGPENVNVNTASSAPANAATNTENASKEIVATGICANEYYPIHPSTVKNFKVSGAEADDYQVSQKDITETGFREDRTFTSGTVVTNSWICTEDGLRTAEFINQGAFSSGNFEMETIESDGSTIPKTFEEGQEWTSDYDVKVKLNVAKMNVNADGTVKIEHKLVSVDEPVTAGGKEYTAARIDSEIRIIVSIKGRTTETGKIKASNWYAKGVGLVKQVTSGTFGETTVEYIGSDL